MPVGRDTELTLSMQTAKVRCCFAVLFCPFCLDDPEKFSWIFAFFGEVPINSLMTS